ncbi:---NA---, partial [Paramuricea clavata]
LTGRGSGPIWTTPSLMVGNSAKSSGQRSKLLAKVGKCPTAPAMPECPLVPIKLCSFDGECLLNQKCCDDGCFGLKCQEP